jgi:hypothetical protein
MDLHRHLRHLWMIPILLPSSAFAQSTIDKAGWLAGCWEAKTPTRSTIEMWMAPAGGMMLGASRAVSNGAVRSYEQLRITAAGDTLVYTANPSGQQEASFRGVATDGVLTFENPAHDFPTRIVYRKTGVDSVVARVEGPGQGGAMRGFDVKMARVSCN